MTPTPTGAGATRPCCPFCGDDRTPATREDKLTLDPGSVFWCECQCCGAQGPVATTAGAALVLWQARMTPATHEQFMELAKRISP